MTESSLGRLERIDLRAVWTSESANFTPWLAQEENLSLLADTIGLDLELVATERPVGPFRADIVCQDTVTGTLVLIENQIAMTDHTHLGQLLTYAAGLDAVTIVWIAQPFCEEHRAALDWLNEVTSQNVDFFGLEIELWRIGDSPIAPKFNVISQPNDWVKRMAVVRSGGQELSETGQLQLEYWQQLGFLVASRSKIIRARKARPQGWASFALGHSAFYLYASLNSRERKIQVGLGIQGSNAKQYYRLLHQQRQDVEGAVGAPLRWLEMPKLKSSYVVLDRPASPLDERESWPQQHEWLFEKLELFHRAFAGRVKLLPASSEITDEALSANASGDAEDKP